MSIGKRRDSHELFIDSQFSYCPLVWIFHSRKNNIKINNIHERCLWLIYSDKRSSYEELFEKNVSVSVHHRIIRYLQRKCTESNLIYHLRFSATYLVKQKRIQHHLEAQFARTVSWEWKYLMSWPKI